MGTWRTLSSLSVRTRLAVMRSQAAGAILISGPRARCVPSLSPSCLAPAAAREVLLGCREDFVRARRVCEECWRPHFNGVLRMWWPHVSQEGIK